MRNNDLVSIILRSKNEARWLRRLLPILDRQSYSNFEIVLVDNNSADGGPKWVVEYGGQVVQIERYLPGVALNLGCAAARGKYFVFLSSHCLPLSDMWLEELVTQLESNVESGCVGVYGRQVATDISSAQTIRDLTITFGIESKNQFVEPFFHNANAIITRDAWEEIPFDESLTNIEDRVWAAMHIAGGKFVRYYAGAEVSHYHGIHHDNAGRRASGTKDVLVERGFSNIFPVRHLFANVVIIFSTTKGSRVGLTSLFDLVREMKERDLVFSLCFVGDKKGLSCPDIDLIDVHVEPNLCDSYYDLIPGLVAELLNLGLLFDSAFIMDPSYINRRIETVEKIYSKYLVDDCQGISTVVREGRNFLIAPRDVPLSVDKQFLRSARATKPSDVVVKCAGYCTILSYEQMAGWSTSDNLSVDLFELETLEESYQEIV